VPGAKQGKLMLGVARQDRRAASALATNVSLALAHHVVRTVEEATDSPRPEA
jgi:hypothetical protein